MLSVLVAPHPRSEGIETRIHLEADSIHLPTSHLIPDQRGLKQSRPKDGDEVLHQVAPHPRSEGIETERPRKAHRQIDGEVAPHPRSEGIETQLPRDLLRELAVGRTSSPIR